MAPILQNFCWQRAMRFTASSGGLDLQHRADRSSLSRPAHQRVRLFLHYGDIADSTNLFKLLYRIQPDEIYHLAAQSHVRVSFDIPEYTGDVTGLGPSGFWKRSAKPV